MKNGKDVHRNLSLFLAFFLFTLTTSIAGQTALKIMPLGNSITFDTYAGDPRSDLEKYSYRYHLYTLLLADGYTFDFVGSEKSGGALLPETPPDYSENAGFPGYTASEILSLLQTGTNRDGDCEIVLCDNSYLQYFNPDIILLHLGTNGLNTEEDADDISEVMDDILNEIDTYESAAGKTVPVFLARIINRAGSNPNGNHDVTSYYNGLLDVVATGRVGDNIIMVDIETGADMDYRLTPSGDMIDELHPAPSGYIKMGTKWHEALESYNFAPPEVSDIPDQVADEGESISIPLDDFVFDPQEHDADLTWSNSGTSNFTVDIDPATRIASVSPVDPDWNGSETVTFEAADPFGVSAQDDVTFTMNPVNDAPVISNIGDQEINEGETFAPVALDDLVTDPDNGKDELNWSYAGNTELSVLIDPDRVATINIPTDWTGDETITFTVTDPDDASDQDAATFTVNALAEAPVANDDSYMVLEAGELNVAAPGVLGNDTDGDGDPLTADLITEPSHDAAFSFQSDGSFTYTHDGSETTTDLFTYRADDGSEQSNDATVTINITPVNDAPVISNIPDQTVNEGETFAPVTLDDLVTDPDNGKDELNWSYAGNTELSVLIDPDRVATINIPTDWTGDETITFTVTDPDDATDQDAATYTMIALASPPEDIALSPASVLENQVAGTLVGSFTTSDPDPGETFTYALVTGTGDADNGNFVISGDELNTALAFNYETKPSHSIRVRSTDATDLFVEKALAVSVLNINEQPTDIALSNASVAENLASGTLVGTLSTTDPDAGDSHSYTLVTGTGDDDNSSFNISGNQLVTDASFNFETKSSFTVRIRTTDAAMETYEEAFIITVTNVNEPPTDIALTSNTIAENQPVNTVIGNLSTTDPDGGDTHEYTLVSGTGSTDNASFNISGNQLRSNAIFDFETKSSYTLRIRVTDAGGAFYEEAFAVTVTNVNENPTDIALSNSIIAENQPVNTVIGNLSTTDPDGGDTHEYTLVSGTGSADNASFNIVGNQLRSSAIFDYETKSSYQIRIRTTDNGSPSLIYEKAFIITVSFANLAPTDITLSATSIPENQPANTVVGTLTATDPNSGDSHTFTLVSGAGSTDNGSFNIAENQLRINGPFDFETKSSYAIRIRATDLLDATFEKQFTITVTNANDTPTDILLSNSEIAENLAMNTVIGNLTTTDPDVGDTHVYSLVAGTGSTDNASFNILGNQLRSSAVFDVETKASYTIRVRTTDNGTGNLFYEKVFIITVTNVNEAPLLDNIEAATLDYDEGEGEVFVTATVTVADVDNTTLSSAVIQITSGFNTAEDRLRYTAEDGITGTFITTTGILNLSGVATLLQYRAALRRVRYENINAIDPTTVTRVVSFTVNDGLLPSNTVTRNISINSVNTAPVLDNIETPALIYCTKPGALPVTASLTVNDIDNDTLSSAIVRIITGLIASEDRLLFTAQNGITGSYTPATGILTLTGLTTLANYQAALRSVRYENINLINPATTGRAISFTVNDGTDNSNAETRNITVNGTVRGILSGSQTICDDGYSTAPLTLDLSGNSPWTFTVRRNVSNDTTYTGITSDPFTINGRVIDTSPTSYRIIAISDANCEGDTASGTVKVSYLTPGSPTAVISGVDTICPGDPAILNVALVGTAPWSITYLRDGANPTVVNNIMNSNHSLQVTNGGTYTLSRVSDNFCTGKVSGSGIVRLYSVPTAVISGSSAPICEHTSTNLSVALTGSSLWKFRYKIGLDTIDVINVATSPKILSVKKGGVYTLVEVIDKFCKGTVSGSVTVNVLPAPDVTLSGLVPAYNSTTNWIPVFGDPEGGVFTGPALFEVRDTMFFFPSIAGVGTHEIVYSWLSPVNLCYGYDTVIVRVLTANADIIFPGDKTFYCFNDAPFVVTGLNTANFTGNFTISGGIGLLDNGNNTATITPALLVPGVYEITYTYYDGAMLQVKEFFTIGNKPVADFAWEGECFHAGQAVSFTDKSLPNEGTIVAYKWLFHNPTGYDSLVTKNATYTYGSPGNYRVDLQIRTSYGCADSLERIFGLRPTVKLLAGDNYFEDFEGPPVGWLKDNAVTPNVNSWVLDIPEEGFSGHELGENCWFTLITSTNAPREQSWVTSPCFDFTDTETPMLKMNIWRLFNGFRDGAVLQASADSGKSWQNVGQWKDGINWFNELSILGNPGGQQIGWANARDVNWIESRHSLDVFKNKKEVQFRFAYGSDGTARDTDGIAFDNFWIGERNRIALVEHFTNASDEDSETANQQLNDIVNNDSLSLIDLQYHTSFPGADPFNGHDPFSTGTRVLYYGLSNVPYTLLNGGSKSIHRFDYEILDPDANTMLVESLLPSLFQININANRSGAALNAEVEVFALQNIPLSELTIHVAVIERVIRGVTGNNGETEFESVVKTLLPDAAGTTLYRSWGTGDPHRILHEWEIHDVYNEDELRIVAFIQDELTHEVYQAAIDTIKILSDITDPSTGKLHDNAFVVFPNPSARLARIKFYSPVKEDIRIELYNSMGSLVFTKEMPEGTDETEIPVEDFPDGIYLIRMIDHEKLVGTGKLTVSK